MDRERELILLMMYMLMKRRRDVSRLNDERRREAQRRVRHRQYFFQRQRRMQMMMVVSNLHSNVRLRTRPWSSTPSTDWWERVVMTEFQPSDWLDQFRMSRETFFFLCEKLRPRLTRQDTSFRQALPVEKRVAVALWRLATNVEYRIISNMFGVGKSTVCRCVRDMCHTIVALLGDLYMKKPSDTELHESAGLFSSRWGFPHCVAAIATLHTAILTPSNNSSDYSNPAGWLSVLSQVAVSGRGLFWDVCASFPGSTDPADILQNSSLWSTVSEGGLSPEPPPIFMGRPLRYVLIGEPCYPLQKWLMKAYTDEQSRKPTLNESQQQFNRRLSRALGVTTEAVLRLRGRWQCLSKRNDCGLDVVPTMILACCILHNICESHGDVFKAEWRTQVYDAENAQPVHHATKHSTSAVDRGEEDKVRRLFCDFFDLQNE
ncbi:uncharacterized protein LOC128747868 [Synchiropus splendidus]|uniref:uncharacterized protein LOC128747868 n=1 Tax=Synchiropus splendidus TaxID=270530 RepID=UPI00237ED85E|nr:uncharacterized protein LOC128747868 [Synchiropus splendidus]